MKSVAGPMEEAEVVRLITGIKTLIKGGDSLEVARKKMKCNSFTSLRYKSISRHPLYLEVANEYLANTKNTKNCVFALVGDRLRMKKRGN